MNLELFIARRIHFGNQKGDKRVSSPAIKIAIAGVAIGLAAMILSVSIVVGFKTEVRNKVIGFGSHIQITNFENNASYDMHPIRVDEDVLAKLRNTDGVKHVEVFSTKPGIIKTDSDFQGIVLKGIGADYDWTFFKQNMVEGDIMTMSDSAVSNQVIISKYIANKLGLKVDDSFITYFIQGPKDIRFRKFHISGIYSTNFEDYDKMFVVADIRHIQKLNDWDKDQVSGIELIVNDYDRLDEVRNSIFLDMMTHRDSDNNTFFARTIKELNPMIFNWLDLLDTNVVVIIVLMLIVSGFTMISGLLIIILERANMIGMLKTMGARNYSIRKTFLYVSSFLVLKGMFWGNIIALVIILIQDNFGLIKLDPDTYYVSEMPVNINIIYILLLNIGTLGISMLMMVGPSYLIAKISPVKAIRFE